MVRRFTNEDDGGARETTIVLGDEGAQAFSARQCPTCFRFDQLPRCSGYRGLMRGHLWDSGRRASTVSGLRGSVCGAQPVRMGNGRSRHRSEEVRVEVEYSRVVCQAGSIEFCQ